jgi:hypothetical protein
VSSHGVVGDPTSMVSASGFAVRLDRDVALATIGTAAAFDRQDTRRHPATSRRPPDGGL